MSSVATSHITIDDHGVARIDGTRMKVLHLIKAMKAGSDSAQQLHEAYPDLTLSQIHAALSYYYDHDTEIDAQIERERAEAEAARANAPETPGERKLRDLGLRP